MQRTCHACGTSLTDCETRDSVCNTRRYQGLPSGVVITCGHCSVATTSETCHVFCSLQCATSSKKVTKVVDKRRLPPVGRRSAFSYRGGSTRDERQFLKMLHAGGFGLASD